jgi:outer membrane protein assembly factor BamA
MAPAAHLGNAGYDMLAGRSDIHDRRRARGVPGLRRWSAAWIVPLCVLSSQVQAQSEPAASDSARASPPLDEEPSKGPAKKKRDLIVAPAPLSNPANGTGFVAGALVFYNPNNAPQQWMSGAGVVYTSRGTKGVGAFHSMSLDQDRWRISANMSYFDARTKYYGIGSEAGDRGEILDLDSKQLTIQFEGLMRIFPRGYLGLRYRLFTVDAGPMDPPTASLPAPPDDQLHSTMSAVGPSFAYDTRDSSTQPHRGVHFTAVWQFGLKALGDSFSHNKLRVAGNAYFPAGRGTVLAVRGSFCSTSGDVPYYDLCLFGSSSDLRGYPSGRYRDRASWAVQGELRQHIAGRFGATIFFGVGGIAPSLGDVMDEGNVLPAAGVGLRYRPFKDNDVQLRVDFGFGKNDNGVYVGIAEAF